MTHPDQFPKSAAKQASASSGNSSSTPLLTLKKSHHIAFSPDGARVVAATGGKIIEIATGKEQATCALPPHTALVAWSPSGAVIAAQSTTGAIRLLDAQNGQKLAQVKMTGEGSALAFTPDGNVLVAGDWNGHLFAWSAANGKLLNQRKLEGMISGITTAVDEIAVLVGAEALALDLELRTERWRVAIDDSLHACLRVAGDERQWFNWQEDDQLVKRSLGKSQQRVAVKLEVAAQGYIKSIGVAPHGRRVCVVYGDEFILLDDSLRELGRRCIPYANAATFSSDSSLVALASWNKGEIWGVDAFPQASTLESVKPAS